jgi:hypothetical protein
MVKGPHDPLGVPGFGFGQLDQSLRELDALIRAAGDHLREHFPELQGTHIESWYPRDEYAGLTSAVGAVPGTSGAKDFFERRMGRQVEGFYADEMRRFNTRRFEERLDRNRELGLLRESIYQQQNQEHRDQQRIDALRTENHAAADRQERHRQEVQHEQHRADERRNQLRHEQQRHDDEQRRLREETARADERRRNNNR